MSLWERFMRVFSKKKIDVADRNNPPYDPQIKKDMLDESARQAVRIADARLPPYSGGLPI